MATSEEQAKDALREMLQLLSIDTDNLADAELEEAFHNALLQRGDRREDEKVQDQKG